MAKLNTLNQTIEYVDSDGSSAPASGATVTIHRAGATVRTTKVIPPGVPTPFQVEGVNTIKAGDTLQHDINTGVTVTVDSVDRVDPNAPIVTITSGAGLTVTAGERMLVIDSTVWVYPDEQGRQSQPADNDLTTDSLGKFTTYMRLSQCDMFITGSMFTADWIAADVQTPRQGSMFTPHDFGATGAADELVLLQHCIDELADVGVKVLHLDQIYLVDGELTLPRGFTLRGTAHRDTGLLQLSTSATTVSSSGANCRLEKMRIYGGGATSTHVKFSHEACTIDTVELAGAFRGVFMEAGATDSAIRYSDISGLSQGVVITDVDNIRLEASTIETAGVGGVALHIGSVAGAMNGIYIGGHVVLNANGGGGAKALWSAGNAGGIIDLTIGGLFVSAGLVDIDYTEVVFAGIEVSDVDLDIDTYTSKASSGIINTDLSLRDSDGVASGTPPTNTYPIRWDPTKHLLWLWNGTVWLQQTVRKEHGELYISSAIPTTVTTAGVYYKILGTTTKIADTVGIDAIIDNNRIKNVSGMTKVFNVHAVVSATPSVTLGTITLRIYKYTDIGSTGTTLPATTSAGYAPAVASENIVVAGTVTLADNDFVEIHVTQSSSGNLVTVINMVFSASEVEV